MIVVVLVVVVLVLVVALVLVVVLVIVVVMVEAHSNRSRLDRAAKEVREKQRDDFSLCVSVCHHPLVAAILVVLSYCSTEAGALSRQSASAQIVRQY